MVVLCNVYRPQKWVEHPTWAIPEPRYWPLAQMLCLSSLTRGFLGSDFPVGEKKGISLINQTEITAITEAGFNHRRALFLHKSKALDLGRTGRTLGGGQLPGLGFPWGP